MKKILLLASVILTVTLVFAACNKTKTYANRLDGGEWKVTELSVDGVNEAELPSWDVEECDGYKETCKGAWKDDHGHHIHFAWQFRDKGKTFEISNQTTAEEATEGQIGEGFQQAEELCFQCQNFSGVYSVKEHKKKSMSFESNSTIGFSGKKVVIKIEKK